METKSLLRRISIPLAGLLLAGGVAFYHPKPKPIDTFNVPLEELIKDSKKYEGNEVITQGYPEYKFISIVPPNVKSVYSLHVEDSTKSNGFLVSESSGSNYLANISGATPNMVSPTPLQIHGKIIKSSDRYELQVEHAEEVKDSTRE